MDTLLNHSPTRVRRRRIEAGLSQTAAAERSGISQSHLSMIERGRKGASAPVLLQIASTYGCEVKDLLPPEDDAPAVAAGTGA